MGKTLNQLAYVPIELTREVRNPLRRRFAITRRGLDRRALHGRERRYLGAHPLAALASIIGESSRTGPVWGVTVVKNEEVRLEGALRRLVADGIDAVIVADNLSTDSTRERLHELSRELPLVVLDYREEGFYQGQAISLLARSATRCGASWIVPFDADELWFGVDGTIKERLHALEGDAAVAPMFDFMPDAETKSCPDPYTVMVRRTSEPVTSKVAFRAHMLASVAFGNHTVSQPAKRVHGALSIRHYPFLGFDHFVQKARRGTAALDQTDLPLNISEHWRERASRDDGQLHDEWASLCSLDLVEDALPSSAFG